MLKLTEAESLIERETADIRQQRPICVALLKSGVKVWLKGRREFFVVDYQTLYRDAMRGDGRINIPARNVSDSKLEKARTAIANNLPEEQ